MKKSKLDLPLENQNYMGSEEDKRIEIESKIKLLEVGNIKICNGVNKYELKKNSTLEYQQILIIKYE